jgi:hypothetical protein
MGFAPPQVLAITDGYAYGSQMPGMPGMPGMMPSGMGMMPPGMGMGMSVDMYGHPMPGMY